MPDFIADIVGSGADLLAAGKQAEASQYATDVQAKLTREQMDFLQKGIDEGIIDLDTAYNIARGYIEPYQDRTAYNTAMSYLKDPSQVMSLPGVAFEAEQGNRFLENLLSGTTGGGASGNAMKAAIEYGQNFAATQLDRALGRLNPFINLGYGASTNLANLAADLGGRKSNLRIGGATQGAGYLGDLGRIYGTNAYNQGNISAMKYGAIGDIATAGINAIPWDKLFNRQDEKVEWSESPMVV